MVAVPLFSQVLSVVTILFSVIEAEVKKVLTKISNRIRKNELNFLIQFNLFKFLSERIELYFT